MFDLLIVHIPSDKMSHTFGFVVFFSKSSNALVKYPCYSVPCCQGKRGELSKINFTNPHLTRHFVTEYVESQL